MLRLFIFVIAFAMHPGAWSIDLGLNARSFGFRAEQAPLVGVEIEFSGLTQQEAAEIVHQVVGGKLVIEAKRQSDWNNKVINEYWVHKIKRSKIGSLRLKPEDNGQHASVERWETLPTTLELISEGPLTADQMRSFDAIAERLNQAGAIGTEGKNAVSLQFTMDVSTDAKQGPVELLQFLRLYFSEDFQKSLELHWPIPQVRLPYVGQFSDGFQSRLMNPFYKPNWDQLFVDYMLRNTLEFVDGPTVWAMDQLSLENRMRELIDQKGLEPLIRGLKWNSVRLSSLFLFLFSDHWLSQYLVWTEWFKPMPAIELRDLNNDFRVWDAYRSLVGLKQISDQGLQFQHWPWLISQAPLNESDLSKLARRFEIVQGATEPWSIRLFSSEILQAQQLQNEVQRVFEDLENNSQAVPIVVPKKGTEVNGPLLLPGDSVVFHHLPYQADFIMGRYNPGLINSTLAEGLSHKLREYAFWQRYASGRMPKTISLADLFEGEASSEARSQTKEKRLQTLVLKLWQEFPEGWVLKQVEESDTGRDFILSHKLDLFAELKIFKQHEFEFRALVREAQKGAVSGDPDSFNRTVRAHPAFRGWRLHKLLKNPSVGLAQSYIELSSEFRVEVVAGQVLNGATQVRYGQPGQTEGQGRSNDREKAELFAASLIEALPFELKSTPFAMDIGVSQAGQMVLIESNPLGNSGFFFDDLNSSRALNRALVEFPERLQAGLVSLGLSEADQLSLLSEISGESDCLSLVRRL